MAICIHRMQRGENMKNDISKQDIPKIHAADILEVILTESDYARYKKLYTWDDMEIIELQIKLRGEK